MLKPLELGAMFPFLPEGKEATRSFGITLSDLLTGQKFERARSHGLARVEAALEGEEFVDLASPGAREEDLLEEILSYLYARILVSAVNDPFLTRKFCVSEAKVFERRLNRLNSQEGEYQGSQQELNPGVRRVLDHLNVSFEDLEDGRIGLHYTDFLRLASSLDQKSWALAIQDVKKGVVRLQGVDAFRLFEEAYHAALANEFPLAISEPVYEAISGGAERMAKLVGVTRSKFEGEEGILDEGSFPPCIQHLLEMTGSGKNVPHMGRFTLVAFLHTIGYDKGGMISLFSRWPDFNVQKSMYQIQHITGETSGTEYTPPTCATMKTYGICYNPDALCQTIRHPLSYYRRKLRIRGKVHPSPETVQETTVPED